MSKGGFDVVVGNPPYVSTKKVPYALSAGDKELFSDIYGHILLQAMALTTSIGRCSMIVPLSIAFSRDFASLRNIIMRLGRKLVWEDCRQHTCCPVHWRQSALHNLDRA